MHYVLYVTVQDKANHIVPTIILSQGDHCQHSIINIAQLLEISYIALSPSIIINIAQLLEMGISQSSIYTINGYIHRKRGWTN